jgi:hypothetical protein
MPDDLEEWEQGLRRRLERDRARLHRDQERMHRDLVRAQNALANSFADGMLERARLTGDVSGRLVDSVQLDVASSIVAEKALPDPPPAPVEPHPKSLWERLEESEGDPLPPKPGVPAEAATRPKRTVPGPLRFAAFSFGVLIALVGYGFWLLCHLAH